MSRFKIFIDNRQRGTVKAYDEQGAIDYVAREYGVDPGRIRAERTTNDDDTFYR